MKKKLLIPILILAVFLLGFFALLLRDTGPVEFGGYCEQQSAAAYCIITPACNGRWQYSVDGTKWVTAAKVKAGEKFLFRTCDTNGRVYFERLVR